MTEETRHKSAIVVLYTAAVILLLIASVLPQISFAKDSDASLVSVQVRKSMMGWNVYLAFDDPSVESGVLQIEGFRDGYPDSRHSLIAKFERVDGVCVANVVNNNYYSCDRIEVVDFVVAPTNAGLNDLYIVPMTIGFVCVFAAFALMYRPVASAVHDGRIFTACQGFTSSKLMLDGKVIAKEKGRNVDYITATADGVVYFASFARPSKPSLAVNGVGVKSKKVDMAKKYNVELKVAVAAVVVLTIGLILCVALPHVLPVDSTVKDDNFVYGATINRETVVYFLPTGTTPVKTGSISFAEVDDDGKIVNEFGASFDVGEDGLARAEPDEITEGKIILKGYTPQSAINLTVPGAMGTFFLLYAVVTLFYLKKYPVACWTIDGHRVIAYVADDRGYVTVDGELLGTSQSAKNGFGSVFGEVGSRRISVFFEKFKAPTLTAEGVEVEEE